MTPPAIPTWDDAFTVGVPRLDEQHRTLFRVLSELGAASHEEEAARERLEELLRDCVSHFADEEDFLARVGYPRIVQQQVQHRLFVGRLSALADRVRRGDATLGEATLDGLTSWLRGHVLGLDREYAEWLRTQER